MRTESHFLSITGFLSAFLRALPQVATRVAFVGLVLAFGRAYAGSADLVLQPQVASELNHVLKASDNLHKSLVAQNEEQIEMGVRDILVQLSRAKIASMQAKPHERRHLVRIIDSAHEQFELTRAAYGDERRIRLEEGYNQLVNLARIYRLDRSYGIFFCPKDRTTWIQKGARPQNPFRFLSDSGPSHREPCAIKVPR